MHNRIKWEEPALRHSCLLQHPLQSYDTGCSVKVTSVPIQLPVNVSGIAAEDDPTAWTPATHGEDGMKLLTPSFNLANSGICS